MVLLRAEYVLCIPNVSLNTVNGCEHCEQLHSNSEICACVMGAEVGWRTKTLWIQYEVYTNTKHLGQGQSEREMFIL